MGNAFPRTPGTHMSRDASEQRRIVAWHGRENCVLDRSTIRFLRAARTLIPTACRIRGTDWFFGTAWSARGSDRMCRGVNSSVERVGSCDAPCSTSTGRAGFSPTTRDQHI